MGRWSVFKKKLEDLFCPELKIQFYANAYPVSNSASTSRRSTTTMGRFWMTCHSEVIWDYPKDFPEIGKACGPYYPCKHIPNLLREYIDTPVKDILTREFADNTLSYYRTPTYVRPDVVIDLNVYMGLAELLIACDRRLGKARLIQWSKNIAYPNVHKILKQRFS